MQYANQYPKPILPIKSFMKSNFYRFLILLPASIVFGTATSQDLVNNPANVYRRSSLHTMVIESGTFPKSDIVLGAFYNAPFPEKYNEHSTGQKSVNLFNYPLSPDEKANIKYKEGGGKKLVGGAMGAEYDSLDFEGHIRIQKYLDQEKIANKMVAKWFNRQEDGSFDMSLIAERGQYDATEMAANIAKGSARGVSSLADAGLELIGNTFIVVSNFKFVSNEPAAAIARDIAKKRSSALIKDAEALKGAHDLADAAYEAAKDGYQVWTNAFLFKLMWNDSIEAYFYNDLWMDKNSVNPAKKEAFDKSNLFKMEFVGREKAKGLVLFSADRTEQEIVELATVRTIDRVFTRLQREYDVFMPKTPLLTGDPITAKIGMKEGLEGGETFEVLEQTIDPKTGLTKYVVKGKIKVEKKQIWDNRFKAGDGPPEPVDPLEQAEAVGAARPAEEVAAPSGVEGNTAAAADPGTKIDRTTFKGGKGYYPGMLIKQVK